MHEPLILLGKLAGLIPELAGARLERKLSSGPLSVKWLLASDAGQWVLRQDKPVAARLNLGRHHEGEVLAALAASGWCSDALWSDVETGVLVVPFVPGRVWTHEDMQQPGQLRRLAELLCHLHSSAVQVASFELADRVTSYAQYLGTPAAAQCAENICYLYNETVASELAVVCHNDPVAGNVIDDGELRLIDFEFAAAGDPLFDIAAVIEHHRLPPPMVEVFTKEYRLAGGNCDSRRLEQWRIIYGHTVSLWNEIVAAC